MTCTNRLRAAHGALATAAIVVAMACTLSSTEAATTQQTADETDLQLPLNDPKVIEQGREKYGERCAFCHGTAGKGSKGPCLTCGVFPYSGNSNIGIYRTIAGGITNRSLGGAMGAFGTTMSHDEIVSVITYLRSEERRRIAAGEVPDPYASSEAH